MPEPDADIDLMLRPVRRPDFVASFLGRELLHIPGPPDKFSGLLDWPSVNDLLCRHIPQLRLVKASSEIPSHLYLSQVLTFGGIVQMRPSTSAITGFLRGGATLIIPGVDNVHGPICRLADCFEDWLKSVVNVNLYASFAEIPGFDIHWDDHDVFVLQIEGSKQWRIYGETERFPLKRSSDESLTPSDVVWESQLNQGDVLYIPRGWWHAATPCSRPSIHLTFGITPLTALDLLGWVRDQLIDVDHMRMDIPRHSDENVQSNYQRVIQLTLNELINAPDLIERFLQWQSLTFRHRATFGLPWTASKEVLPGSADCLIKLVAPGSMVVRHVDGTEEIELAFEGKGYRFNKASEVLLRALAESPSMRIGDFYGRFAESFEKAELQVFLTDLLVYGIIAVLPKQS